MKKYKETTIFDLENNNYNIKSQINEINSNRKKLNYPFLNLLIEKVIVNLDLHNYLESQINILKFLKECLNVRKIINYLTFLYKILGI